jgi:hypothetical protein
MNQAEYQWMRALIRENGESALRWAASSEWLKPGDIERFKALATQQDDYLALRARAQAGGQSPLMALQLCAPEAIFEAWRKRSRFIR